MCNLYKPPINADLIARMMRARDRTGNEPWPELTYKDRQAPIIRHGEDGPEIVTARWGMPSPTSLLKTARDPGVSNVRNLRSPHWRRWLGKEHRCLVPVEAFAEPLGRGKGNQWFTLSSGERAFFAGIETRGWRSVRKVKEGETTDDLYAFLTCEPNAEVRAVHPKAMPVILTRSDHWQAWLNGVTATELQRPLPDGSLSLIDPLD